MTLTEICREAGCSFTENAPMCDYTTFRIGGTAQLLATPCSEKELADVIRLANRENVPLTVLGKGSNVLVSDSGIKGLTVLTSGLDTLDYDGDCTITCGAGVPLIRLCSFALEHSLSGMEFAYGIPGSAGGAAYMNAGAYGGEMKDVLVKCTHIAPDGTFGVLEGENLKLSYRHSAYTENGFIITSITVKLCRGNQTEIKAKMDDLLSRRKDKQPLDKPSAGSTFKRPEGYFAGALIEQCGLRGFSVGGAQISEKHCGFVVNNGGATAKDVLDVVEHAKNTVFEKTGVSLEPEIKFIG